jgi:hypothetical protein
MSEKMEKRLDYTIVVFIHIFLFSSAYQNLPRSSSGLNYILVRSVAESEPHHLVVAGAVTIW